MFFRTPFLVVCGLLIAQSAIAFEYQVKHDFRLLPIAVGPNPTPPTASWKHIEHTWAIDMLTPAHDWDVTPGAVLPGGFDAFGRDRERRDGQPLNLPRIGGPGALLNPVVTPIPVGGPWAQLSSVTSTDAGATANANSRINIITNPGDYTAPLVGSHEVFGSGLAPGPPSCYGFSWSQVEVRGAIMRGGVFWKPTIKMTNPISASGRDPINFRAFDLDTQTWIDGNLFDVDWTINDGTVNWENNVMHVDAESIDFHMQLASQYIPLAQQGTADLIIHGGTVMQSNDTGIWDGLLPSAGTVGPFTFTMPNEILFEFDLGDFGGHPMLSEFEFSASDEGIDPVPEPSALIAFATGLGFLASRRLRAR